MTEQIKVRQEGAVAIIEFANPPMNFISHVMLQEFHRELIRVKQDRTVRVLVLTGGMKDSFLTHYDVAELLAFSEKGDLTGGSQLAARLVTWLLRQMQERVWLENFILQGLEKRSPAERGIFYWSRCLELLDTLPKPVIAAINGLALGGGCEISLCCDFRFMSRGEYYRIGLPEVLVGIIPGGTGTPLRLPRVVGEAKALEMLLTGTLYTPEAAEAMGLIHRALAPEELMPAVMELAERLARGAPLAQASIKKDVRLGSRLSYAQARALDLAVTNAAVYSEDARRGMRRYVEEVAKYDSLDLKVVLANAEEFLAARAVEYQGQ
ncbi:MAG: hypothetical protein A2V67_04385 [Deltaproteobacteria bacterium RBG_13_61_14]|nr:MAG: hypothetical protein A2V67_04385 [Deltaproteobacteria bacterium RBG_13_61_14]